MKNERASKVVTAFTCVVIAAVLIVGGGWIYASDGLASDSTTVAKVNGDPITVAEFKRALGLQRAAVIDYFKQTYGAELHEDFWHTEMGGETPADKARALALEEAVKIKMILRLAESQEIVQGSSYDEVLAAMKKENERRSVAVQAGQPIYGPVRFDESTFVEFYLSTILIELKEKLTDHELAVSDAQLRQHYESIKDELFMLADTLRFYHVSASYMVDGRFDSGMKQKAKSLMDAVKQQLEQGESLDAAIQRPPHDDDYDDEIEIVYSEEHVTHETARTYFKSQTKLYAALTELTDRQRISPVIDDRAAGRYVLAVMLERTSNGYSSFEEQYGNVRKHYLDTIFDAYLKQRVEEAEVKIVQDVYSQIVVE